MRWLTTTALLLMVSPASGSPLLDPHLGGVMFTGPTAGNLTSIYYNPAALSLDDGTHLFVSGSLRLDQTNIARAAIDPATGAPGGSQSIPSSNLDTLTPGGFAAFMSDFNNRNFTLALGIYAPVAERFHENKRELGYHVLGGHDYEWFLTIAMAYRVNGKLSVGFGVHVVAYSSFELQFLRDTALEEGTAGLAGVGAENPDAAAQYDIDVERGFGNLSFNAGLVFQPRPGWMIGFGFTAPPGGSRQFEVVSNGDVTVTAAPTDGGGVYTGRARVTYKLPFVASLEGRAPLMKRHDVVVGLRWNALGRQQQWDVRMYGGELSGADTPDWYPRYRGLQDVWMIEAGVEGREHDPVRLGGRLRLETPAVAEELISPTQVAGLNLSLLAGAELRITQKLAVVLGYALTWYPTQTVEVSAFDPVSRIECVDSGYQLGLCADAGAGRGIPSAAGTYRRLQHGGTLALRWDWL